MRIPVFARGANPAVDRPILRKSMFYAHEQVEVLGRADWADPADHSKGIICREILYFGARPTPAPQKRAVTKKRKRGVLPPVESNGTKFRQPATLASPHIAAITTRFLCMAARQFASAQA